MGSQDLAVAGLHGLALAVAVVAVGYVASVSQSPDLGTPWAILVGGGALLGVAYAAGVYYVDAAGLVQAT